jgi:hypothetical protein
MEWPAAPDAICPKLPASYSYSDDIGLAAKFSVLPILPHHNVYMHGPNGFRRFNNRFFYCDEVVHVPLFFVRKYDLTVVKQKCDVGEVLERVSNVMRQDLGRDVKGLLLHYNVNAYFHTNWPPTDLSPHLVVDLETAGSCDLQELRGVDFVVANVWGRWSQAVNLVNVIGKPVFWCFNKHVTPSITIVNY